MKLQELVLSLDEELHLDLFREDCSNNGLQVEGASEVRRAVFAVDGCQAVFDEAARRHADFLFVHHGISWGPNPRRFTGIDGNRLRVLFQHNLSLYAAHLPLDAHPKLGNNAELARIAGVIDLEPYCEYDGVQIGFLGRPDSPFTLAELAKTFEEELSCHPLISFGSERPCRKVAIVSGGGGMDALVQAADAGADLLLTGEMTHIMYHYAEERGISVVALGHYHSETVGPRAVMGWISRRFDLSCEFIELAPDLPPGI